MRLVQLSDGYGVNMDAIVEWYDRPEEQAPDGTIFPARLQLVMCVRSEGYAHTIRLEGDEREAMLHYLAKCGDYADWGLESRVEEARVD